MPEKPWKPCNRPGCPNLTKERFCEADKHLERRYDQERDKAARKLYDRRWQAASRAFVREKVFCECDECRVKPEMERDLAEVTDHITPHRGDVRLFWNRTNWRAMSKRHHDRATAMYDGGFGNTTKQKR